MVLNFFFSRAKSGNLDFPFSLLLPAGKEKEKDLTFFPLAEDGERPSLFFSPFVRGRDEGIAYFFLWTRTR